MNKTDHHDRRQPQPYRPYRWPKKPDGHSGGIWFGGDYNPDQWPEQVWAEDVALMKRAGVTMVTLGIFSWARLEPSDGVWDFGWLDRVVALLGEAGIAVDMASATATAPYWLYQAHPEVLPVEADGTLVHPGTRQSWRPTSPVFRRYALRLCRVMGEHFRDNPTVVAWHVGNEYGWNNAADYSQDALKAFQGWCRRRYSNIEELNQAWGNDFWSQRLQNFDQVPLPEHAGVRDAFINPALRLDFRRFCSDALMDFFCTERDQLQELTPDKPLTTNFMVSTDQCVLDYERWSHQVDFVANDHYFAHGPGHLDELLCSDSLVDAYAQGHPWCLMEHSTSAVNWRNFNASKRQGELIRDALAHVATGADAVNFFQWRQSAFGAEAFHSAMIPHAGPDSAIYAQVADLGSILRTLSSSGLAGTQLEPSSIALLFDADCQWSMADSTLPDSSLDHWRQVYTWYKALLDAGYRADVMPLKGQWERYDVVVLPALILLDQKQADRLRDYVSGGGRLVVDFASGIMDDHMHVGLGGYPAALRDLTGIASQEMIALGTSDQGGGSILVSEGIEGNIWVNEPLSIEDSVKVLARYQGRRSYDLDMVGKPAVTIHGYGQGRVLYLGTGFAKESLVSVINRIFPLDFLTGPTGVGLHNGGDGDPRLVHLIRSGPQGRYHFYFNRGSTVVRDVSTMGETLVVQRATRCSGGGLSGNRYTIGVHGVVVTRQ